MNKDAFEPSFKRMSKIWTSRNERTNTLKVRVTAAHWQENEGTISAMARNLVQKQNALRRGAGKAFI